MANTLFLRLEAPLQAWGERARWTVRDNAPEPTKSGVIGLLGCALGLREDDALASLDRSLVMGVRCDLPGKDVVDYHTIVGGVMSAEGKVKINAASKVPETVISWRHYLADASFVVALLGQLETIERLAGAVQRPVWPLFLGRKACVPALPVYAGVGEYASLEEALRAAPISARVAEAWRRSQPAYLRGVVECAPAQGARRRDALISRRYRTFGARYTREVQIAPPPLPDSSDNRE